MERLLADGMVTGIGAINGDRFGDPASWCAALAYDYTVLAGTQGSVNHRKTDRLLEVAAEARMPVVLFTEGGGGRAGPRNQVQRAAGGHRVLTQVGGPADVPTWRRLGALSGLVPIVGVNPGFSFAGNAAVLGMCDVTIATANSSIGMGGSAMVKGGGLGVFRPEEIGPMDVPVPNSVVDVAVADEAEAVAVAKRDLSYFQGRLPTWEAHDQRRLRRAVPENRLRVYDVRKVVEVLADVGSVLELRPAFGRGMITALARIDLPVLSRCDTPGIMVGPEAERTARVRHAARMFVTGTNITVPLIAVVLRKAYGLGVMTMAGATFKSTTMTVSWPTGEFAGMGLEGSLKLRNRAALAAIEDPDERRRRYDELVAAAYEQAAAVHQGESYGVDDVIDPADTRAIVAGVLAGQRPPPPRATKKRPNLDTW